MTTRPLAGDRRVKKAAFQNTLTMSWAAKKSSAVLDEGFSGACCQTRNRDIPISVNKMIQINPMVEPDGVKEGLIRVGYHSAIDPAVSAEPITPAIWHMIMLKMRRKISFLFILYQPSREAEFFLITIHLNYKWLNVLISSQRLLEDFQFIVCREDRTLRLKRNIWRKPGGRFEERFRFIAGMVGKNIRLRTLHAKKVRTYNPQHGTAT